jgi:hypothetical protein
MHDLLLHKFGAPSSDSGTYAVSRRRDQATAALLAQAVPSANSDAQAYTSVRQAFMKIYR